MSKIKSLKSIFKPRQLSKTAAIAVVVVIIAIAVGLYFAFKPTSNTSINIPSSDPLATSSSQNSSNQPSNSQNQAQNSPSTSPGTKTAPSGPPPATPFGDFVSNHHPGGSAPTSEASACNTSAGATCYIKFTKGSVVKKLDTHTTNANGGAIWYWDVNSAGLSAGTWTITAVATLNGQTRTANDVQNLVVQ